ncbi:hypothetical protein QNH14_10875 [Apirhabdus apintestini]|nr:hypothetical protein QNH14_10875 [Enterobacteriaceae bacterium CA-0114]
MTGIGRNSVQGDIRFADVLERMGAEITWVMIILPAPAANSMLLIWI